MRTIAICLAVAALCGACGRKATPDAAAFRAALVEYLRINSMDMKPDAFEALSVEGDRAVAKVRMATKDDLYGMKPLWTVTFERTAKGWTVTNVER